MEFGSDFHFTDSLTDTPHTEMLSENIFLSKKLCDFTGFVYLCIVDNQIRHVMMARTIPHNSVSSYWNIVKHLSPDAKIDLITMLSQSLKAPSAQVVSAKKYYGIWADDGMTDEEFIEEIKSMRNFSRDIVEL